MILVDHLLLLVQPAQIIIQKKQFEYSKPQSGIEKAKDLFETSGYAQALAYLIEYANSDNADALYMIGFCLYIRQRDRSKLVKNF